MGLLDELEGDSVPNRKRCSVCLFLDSITDKERDEWETAFKNPSITAAALTRAFQRRAIRVNRGAVEKHSRGEAHADWPGFGPHGA